jgi:AsmA protein
MELPRGHSLKDLSASGPVHWNGTSLTFENGTFSLDGNTAVGLLAVTPSERPAVEGTLAFEHLVLDPYLGGEETETVEGPLFGWALLKHFNADLRISASEISASNVQLGRGGFTVTAKNGAVSIEIGELELCGGEVSGRVELDLSAARVKGMLDGSLSNIALEPCFQPFAFGVPIEGVGSLRIDVSTGGYTLNGLVRGLAGNFKLSAENGRVPVDLSQITTGTDAEGDGWNSESTTPFEILDADCRLSAGHIWCQSFEMRTPRGLVSGSGGVDVGQLTLDWDFLIANPVAQLSASQLVMEPPPRITISGPLTQPLIQRANRSALDDGSTQSSSGNVPVAPR